MRHYSQVKVRPGFAQSTGGEAGGRSGQGQGLSRCPLPHPLQTSESFLHTSHKRKQFMHNSPHFLHFMILFPEASGG